MKNIARALLVLQEVYQDEENHSFAGMVDVISPANAAEISAAVTKAVAEKVMALEQFPDSALIRGEVLKTVELLFMDCDTSLCRALTAYKRRLAAIRTEAEDIAILLYYDEIGS